MLYMVYSKMIFFFILFLNFNAVPYSRGLSIYNVIFNAVANGPVL
jgi:hypothetical protein